MEEQVRGVLFERDAAYFVHDDQSVAAQSDEFLGQLPFWWAARSRATQSMAVANDPMTELRGA